MQLKRFIHTFDGRILDLEAIKKIDTFDATPDESFWQCAIDFPGRFEYGLKHRIQSQSDCIDDLFNRYLIKSGHMLSVKTKLQFGKLNRASLLRDIASGKKIVYGCIWTYNNKHFAPTLTPVADLNSKGDWTLI